MTTKRLSKHVKKAAKAKRISDIGEREKRTKFRESRTGEFTGTSSTGPKKHEARRRS